MWAIPYILMWKKVLLVKKSSKILLKYSKDKTQKSAYTHIETKPP